MTIPAGLRKPLDVHLTTVSGVQLKDGGTVTCQLKVDGVTIVSATASGTDSVASCAMDQNLNGSWEETTLSG